MENKFSAKKLLVGGVECLFYVLFKYLEVHRQLVLCANHCHHHDAVVRPCDRHVGVHRHQRHVLVHDHRQRDELKKKIKC